VADAGITQFAESNTTDNYKNWGAAATSDRTVLLVRFDLSGVERLSGGTVSNATLQMRITAGNTVNPLYRVNLPWVEGNKNNNYPGVSDGAYGVSAAHPSARNTTGSRNTEDGTTPPLKTWTDNLIFSPAKAGDASMPTNRVTISAGSHVVYDITSIVKTWVETGETNCGIALHNSNCTFRTSEDADSKLRPVLFLSYAPAALPPGGSCILLR
jgi:hypothetical protein